jgi:lysophospholipase L1-like esterase
MSDDLKAENQASKINSAAAPTTRRWLWIACFGLLVLPLIGITTWHFWFHVPIGSGPAGPTVSSAAFSTPWSKRTVLLVGFGDSVTAGFGARRGYSYFDRILNNSADEFPEMRGISMSAALPNLRATNLAVSGSVSKELIESQLPRLPVSPLDTFGIITITTGGNDLIHNYGRTPPREHAMYGATWAEASPWVDAYALRLETIVTAITNRFPGGCRILLANIYDPTDGMGDIQRTGLPAWPDGMKILAAYNQVIAHCAEKHGEVKIVNLHDAFLGHGTHCTQFWSRHYDARDPHYWYYDNLEDPNERGYDVIRRLFLLELSQLASDLK